MNLLMKIGGFDKRLAQRLYSMRCICEREGSEYILSPINGRCSHLSSSHKSGTTISSTTRSRPTLKFEHWLISADGDNLRRHKDIWWVFKANRHPYRIWSLQISGTSVDFSAGVNRCGRKRWQRKGAESGLITSHVPDRRLPTDAIKQYVQVCYHYSTIPHKDTVIWDR